MMSSIPRYSTMRLRMRFPAAAGTELAMATPPIISAGEPLHSPVTLASIPLRRFRARAIRLVHAQNPIDRRPRKDGRSTAGPPDLYLVDRGRAAQPEERPGVACRRIAPTRL